MRVLSVDPGPDAGLALYEAPNGDDLLFEHVESWHEPDWEQAIARVRREILVGLDVLVIESFIITGQTGKKSRAGANATIEMIGAIRWLCLRSGTPMVEQQPGSAVSFSTAAKLKRLGWYTTNDHARSAVRHLVLYLADRGVLSVDRLLGSDGGGGG